MSSFNVGTVKDLLNIYKSGVYDFTKNGKCCCCGKCCSNVLPMSILDVNRIRRYMETHEVKEHRHNMPLANPVLDMTCPFLDDSKELKCSIYDARPDVCRQFLCSNFRNGKKPKTTGQMYTPIDVREEFFGGRK